MGEPHSLKVTLSRLSSLHLLKRLKDTSASQQFVDLKGTGKAGAPDDSGTKLVFSKLGCKQVWRGYTQACDKDPQCGGGMCCAVSIWVKSIRICTPMGKVGDSCHPLTRKVPFFGRRMHHTCPCMPGLACLRTSFNRFICLARK
nr:PREDICTED: prokineticin-2 isoform X1 [Equus przewalskii]